MADATAPLLIDTDVLIDYLRGKADIVAYIANLSNPLFVSAITVAELYVGVRNEIERAKLDQFLLAFITVPLDHYIAVDGGKLRRSYGPSHGTGLADALIAATAQQKGQTLVTRNQKHYPMLTSVIVP